MSALTSSSILEGNKQFDPSLESLFQESMI